MKWKSFFCPKTFLDNPATRRLKFNFADVNYRTWAFQRRAVKACTFQLDAAVCITFWALSEIKFAQLERRVDLQQTLPADLTSPWHRLAKRRKFWFTVSMFRVKRIVNIGVWVMSVKMVVSLRQSSIGYFRIVGRGKIDINQQKGRRAGCQCLLED